MLQFNSNNFSIEKGTKYVWFIHVLKNDTRYLYISFYAIKTLITLERFQFSNNPLK